MLVALYCASFELQTNKIYLIIEDISAKIWLQGQLKHNNKIFDQSFNSEISKVESEFLDYVTYENLFRNPPIYKENDQIVEESFLKVLSTYPGYTIF